MNPYHKEAKWYKSTDDKYCQCFLCPRNCTIAAGKTGFCSVRSNIDGVLYSDSYGHPVAGQIDPIEKKPLAGFLPGTKTFSIGTLGCNLNCSFCQNNSLSRGTYGSSSTNEFTAPKKVVELALEHRCKSIAFTYNEPTVFAEYCIDIANIAKQKKIKTVLVSNGYITLDAAADLYPLIDAANIDMKGFSEEFYKSMTGAHLEPVLESMKYYHVIGGHLEITNLVIPNKNDSPEMIESFLDWVKKELDTDINLHFSAYHPAYKYNESPRTSADTLYHIKNVAEKKGFKKVFLGNIW